MGTTSAGLSTTGPFPESILREFQEASLRELQEATRAASMRIPNGRVMTRAWTVHALDGTVELAEHPAGDRMTLTVRYRGNTVGPITLTPQAVEALFDLRYAGWKCDDTVAKAERALTAIKGVDGRSL